MRLLAKHLLVVIIPEAYTSKSCYYCDVLRSAEAHNRLRRVCKDKNGKDVEREVRGLRVCTNQSCSAHCLNRDLNAALNICKRARLMVRRQQPPNMAAVAEKVLNDPHMRLCAMCADDGGGG